MDDALRIRLWTYWFVLGAWSMVTLPAGIASGLGHRSADLPYAVGMAVGLLIYALMIADRILLERNRSGRARARRLSSTVFAMREDQLRRHLLALPNLVTIPQAAPLMRLHPAAAGRMVRAGTFPLPLVRVGGRRYVRRAELLQYLRRHHQQVTAVEAIAAVSTHPCRPGCRRRGGTTAIRPSR